MIVASFDKAHNRSAAVSGAYQYDTGQRLAMHGLPSPSEMAGEDNLLSGDLVTVQAQFSYKGDSQAVTVLAQWNEDRKVWLADVPDDYLTAHRDVHVYVYVYYGADEYGERAETAYEATFRPISRPAPNNVVTEGQLEQWATMKEEIEISLAKVDNAVNGANNAANNANNSANNASKSAQDAAEAVENLGKTMGDLERAGARVGKADGETESLPAGSKATARLELLENIERLTIGAPKGANGKKGAVGDIGPADVSFEYDAETGTLTITTKGEE